jgi:hypothetical protein
LFLAVDLSRNDECVEGGLSIVLDSIPVLEELRAKRPEYFVTLTKVEINFMAATNRYCPDKELAG